MQVKSQRKSVDLNGFPDLVVVYLGFQVNRWRAVGALMGLGPQISQSVRDRPDGLLAHEQMVYSLTHIGMRQYWRDMESLERFTRSEPHKTWWRDFTRDSQGAGFWHETYARRGGMEAI